MAVLLIVRQASRSRRIRTVWIELLRGGGSLQTVERLMVCVRVESIRKSRIGRWAVLQSHISGVPRESVVIDGGRYESGAGSPHCESYANAR